MCLLSFTVSPQFCNWAMAGSSSWGEILRAGATMPTQCPGFKKGGAERLVFVILK